MNKSDDETKKLRKNIRRARSLNKHLIKSRTKTKHKSTGTKHATLKNVKRTRRGGKAR